MFGSRVSSWNLRDSHMVETLEALRRHLGRGRAAPPRIAVWAHNSHLGDARATELGEHGEWNVGQLVRERHGDAAALLGFTTYDGTVTAASDWDGPLEIKRVRPGLAGSCEALFHDTGIGRFACSLRGDGELARRARRAAPAAGDRRDLPAGDRAPEPLLPGPAGASSSTPSIHLDRTRAVEPLDGREPHPPGEPPETCPSGV